MDDELNILPTSSRVKDIEQIPRHPDGSPVLKSEGPAKELKSLTDSLQDTLVGGKSGCFAPNMQQQLHIVFS